MDMQNNSRAAELRLYLKSRMSSMPYRGLIRDIYVSEDKDGKSLDVSIIPNCDVVAFGTINIGLAGADTDSKWRRKQKDIYGKVKGCCPKVSPSLSERILREAGEKLEIWRIEHPFSEELTEFLESDTASANLFYNKIDTLRFLAGNEPLSCAGSLRKFPLRPYMRPHPAGSAFHFPRRTHFIKSLWTRGNTARSKGRSRHI